jgi:hypothetical protein
MEYCNVDERTGSARCQAIVDPEGIMDVVLAYLESAEVAQEAA